MEDGTFFDDHAPEPVPAEPVDALPGNPWAPFEEQIAFDFTQYYYVQLQSSAAEVTKGLDILLANMIKHGSCSALNGWESTKDMYHTIDSIQTGNAPWKTYKFWYT